MTKANSPTSRAPRRRSIVSQHSCVRPIGFDAKRGDQIEVVNLRFAETTPLLINEPTGWMSYPQFTKDDIVRGAQSGVTALFGLVVLFTVVRRWCAGSSPRMTSRPAPVAPGALATSSPQAMAAGGMGIPGVAADHIDGRPQRVDRRRRRGGAISTRTSAMIDIAKVQGQVHAQSVQKVGELADKNPHEAVSIIRNWLHEHAA